MCMVVIIEIIPLQNLAAVSGAIGITFAVSSSLGPVIGGAITKATHWRWIFLLNVPPSAAAIVLVLLAWRTQSRTQSSIEGKLSIT